MGNTFLRRERERERERESRSVQRPPRAISEFYASTTAVDLSENLAPKTSLTTEDAPECPICFKNYEFLNTASCCKETICTNCFLELKHSKHETCPYCSNQQFKVIYIKKTSIKLNTPDDKKSVSSKASTPSSSTKSSVPLASVDDRRQLEKEMQNQREILKHSMPPPPPIRSQSLSDRRYQGYRRGGNRDRDRSASDRYPMPTLSRRTQSGRVNDLEEEFDNEDGLNIIRTFLMGGGPGIRLGRDHLSDTNQLEEIMLMQAIKLSLEDQAKSQANAETSPATEEFHTAKENDSTTAATTETVTSAATSANSTPLKDLKEANQFDSDCAKLSTFQSDQDTGSNDDEEFSLALALSLQKSESVSTLSTENKVPPKPLRPQSLTVSTTAIPPSSPLKPSKPPKTPSKVMPAAPPIRSTIISEQMDQPESDSSALLEKIHLALSTPPGSIPHSPKKFSPITVPREDINDNCKGAIDISLMKVGGDVDNSFRPVDSDSIMVESIILESSLSDNLVNKQSSVICEDNLLTVKSSSTSHSHNNYEKSSEGKN